MRSGRLRCEDNWIGTAELTIQCPHRARVRHFCIGTVARPTDSLPMSIGLGRLEWQPSTCWWHNRSAVYVQSQVLKALVSIVRAAPLQAVKSCRLA